MRDYPMLVLPLGPEDGGGWLALFPDLPGCMSDGETPAEAALNGQDALRCWLAVQAEDGGAAPGPGSVLAPLLLGGLGDRTDSEARFLRSLLGPGAEALDAPPRRAAAG